MPNPHDKPNPTPTPTPTPTLMVAVVNFDRPPSAAQLANPDLDVLNQRYRWRELNPHRGVYDWSQIDSDFAAIKRAGKRVMLAVGAGTDRPWFAANLAAGNVVRDVYGAHETVSGNAHVADIPVPWDLTYHAALFAFIDALKGHLAAAGLYDVLWAVRVTGINEDTEEIRMPRQSPSANPTLLTTLHHDVFGVSWADGASAIESSVGEFIASDVYGKVHGVGLPAGSAVVSPPSPTVAPISHAATSAYAVPATDQFVVTRDVTGLGMHVTDAQAHWLAAGYRPSKAVDAYKSILGKWASTFPDKLVAGAFIVRGGFPNIDDAGNILPGLDTVQGSAVVDATASYGARAVCMRQSLSPTANYGPFAAQVQAHPGARIGYQLEEQDFDTLNGGTASAQDLLDAGRTGIAAGAFYLEVWDSNLTDFPGAIHTLSTTPVAV